MNPQELPLGFHEKTIFKLRSLYNRYGYSQYKMSKFEEYDLYARNKDFLISDSVITFTDLNGKLMALKPDVTLSIVKNTRDDATTQQKLYYNENVYRVSKGSHAFQEIMQAGLECIGTIDDYCICEVLQLAGESLRCICDNAILDISHLDVLTQLTASLGIRQTDRLLQFISQKNLHELSALCREEGVSEEQTEILRQLVTTSGSPDTVLPKLEKLLSGVMDLSPVQQLGRILSGLSREVLAMIRIDFSVVDDIHYYNGIVFKGFVQGLPNSILSGGQYDKLMRKMKHRSGAIGFAVYTDMLALLDNDSRVYDVDTVLLYDESTPLTTIRSTLQKLTETGISVTVQRQKPVGLRFRQLLKLHDSEVEILEQNA